MKNYNRMQDQMIELNNEKEDLEQKLNYQFLPKDV